MAVSITGQPEDVKTILHARVDAFVDSAERAVGNGSERKLIINTTELIEVPL